ncbi:MAG TPA: cyanophycinase [Terriglobales bacterium]|jgi:cyanophycinase
MTNRDRLKTLMLSRNLCLTFILLLVTGSLFGAPYKYKRTGQKTDKETQATRGIAMMGGGSDLDEAFKWLCDKANGGDFLILRARGSSEYNGYVKKLCSANSVATLVIPTREAAQDPKVSDIISHAEAIFIAGGDQSRYVNFWKGTPVQDAINADIAAGKPIGGTSAGLAVLGQFAYGALGDAPNDADLASKDVLSDPFHKRVTVVRDFLKVPHLENTLTDSHFAKRDRMGRSLVFLARIIQDGWSRSPREVAIDERSAVLVEGDGKGTVVGLGRGAYFMRPSEAPEVCKPQTPVTFSNVDVYHAPTGAHFDLGRWVGDGGNDYGLSIDHGVVKSTQSDGGIY